MALAPPTTQRVLLGFKDAALEDEASSWDVSKIGGLPDAPPQVLLISPSCGLCSSALSHVVQVYCPLEGSPFHRVIHVFACSRKPCWGKNESWAVLRSQGLEVQESQKKETPLQQEENLAATDWGEDADNWGLDGEEPAPLLTSHVTRCPTVSPRADCVSQLQGLSLGDRPRRAQSGRGLFRSFYVGVAEEEDCVGAGDIGHAQRLLREYEQREGILGEERLSESAAAKGESEKYEKSEVRSRDVLFHKFLKKISPCRQQILRYSWNGDPLYMRPPPSGPGSQTPPCAQCGGRRVFEFQLMPALVSMLQGDGAGRTLCHR
ncbi:programmed cell death protein 2-like [Ascaphus truei]|uniref:programmed cell death protein 2-like n=1 Tax=Ascaphus truei TaxID=8439 RepID=UPI003F59A509